MIRNRIKGHRRVRAGDLIPHELNWRTHPDDQRQALAALYQEVGFSRSLLAFELPDGRLKLIDGHLRRDIDPDMMVDVEILDVDEAEARKLLLSIDSLAGLAGIESAALEQLTARTQTESEELDKLWRSLAAEEIDEDNEKISRVVDQFLILVECDNESEQVRLLERFQKEGIRCRALVS
jgi:hypothetical protein